MQRAKPPARRSLRLRRFMPANILTETFKMKHPISLFIILFTLSCSTTKFCCLEEPKYSKDELYIKHAAYSLVYDEAHKQPAWVAYQLLASELKPNFSRTTST